MLVFPGAHQLNMGGTNPHAPYLTGVGAVFIGLILAPLVTICGVALSYLGDRKSILRSEDPFHRALWVCTCYTTAMYLCTRTLCARYLTTCCCCACHHGVHAHAKLLLQLSLLSFYLNPVMLEAAGCCSPTDLHHWRRFILSVFSQS